MSVGHSVTDLEVLMQKIGATNMDDVLRFLGGKPTQSQVMASGGKFLNDITFDRMPKTVGRFAGSGIGRGIARAVPLLSVAGNVMDLGDIVGGGDSFGNKAMDAAGMAIGGTAGAMLGGPLGASLGASTGKFVSDTAQSIFGGGKSAEERRMEEALLALRGGQI